MISTAFLALAATGTILKMAVKSRVAVKACRLETEPGARRSNKANKEGLYMHQRIHRLIGASALCAAMLPAAAWADVVELKANLDGQQAGTISTATGLGLFTYDDDSNVLNWNITFSGLTSAETVAHFHGPGAPGVNAPIQPPALALGPTKTGMAALQASQEADLLNGLYYVNIHSQMFPGGEIRGQIMPVPEVSTFMMMGAGAITLAIASRLRRKEQASPV